MEGKKNEKENSENKKDYVVLSIDVGVIHLGISVSILNHDYTLKDIIWVDNIDITSYEHRSCSQKDCTLYHTRMFSDWIDHMCQENKIFFDCADYILIEKQPPVGFVVVEQLLFHKYRNKTVIISPRSVHNYLNIGSFDYESRKHLSEKIADRVLPPHLIEQTMMYDRRHDISDSICILLYFMNKKQTEWKRKEMRKNLHKDQDGLDVFEKLELYRFLN
jgi:hypothetical protein